MDCDHAALGELYPEKRIRDIKYAGITHVACPDCATLFEPITNMFQGDWYLIRNDLT